MEAKAQVHSRAFNAQSLLRRYEANPILTPDDWPYPTNAVFNPGATMLNNETILLVRVEDMRGFSHLTLARSKDGKTSWRIDPEPTLVPDRRYREEQWGIEDPRIVWLEDREEFAIIYVSFSKGGPVVSLITTKDFTSFRRFGALLPPEDKDAALFPCRFGDYYALIHRPIIRGEAHIWLSLSPDLLHWGQHRILIPVRPGWWDCHRVGLGTPPIRTDEGWLIIYHGVRNTASGALYRVGLALLDLEKPWKVIRRSDEWIFSPSTPYERFGDVPGVTFPTGATVDEKTNEIRVYYGAADSSVALATGNLGALVEYVKTGQVGELPLEMKRGLKYGT